jgi:hypothetical protein
MKLKLASVVQLYSSPQPKQLPEPVDLTQVNTRDNRFIWVALITIGLTLGGLIWWNL